MPEIKVNKYTKLAIISTNVFLVMAPALLHLEKLYDLPLLWELIMFASLGGIIFGYWAAFKQTGLWKFTHSKIKEFNENEQARLGKIMQISYALFSTLILGYLLLTNLLGIDIFIYEISGLIFLAHIIPASVLGWKLSDECKSETEKKIASFFKKYHSQWKY